MWYMFVLIHYDACIYVDVILLITLIVNEYGRITICHESPVVVWLWNIHYDCDYDCGVLNGLDCHVPA